MSMKKYDAIICLGVILWGAPHFEYVAGQVDKITGSGLTVKGLFLLFMA